MSKIIEEYVDWDTLLDFVEVEYYSLRALLNEQVFHETYGLGRIIKVGDDQNNYVTIAFEKRKPVDFRIPLFHSDRHSVTGRKFMRMVRLVASENINQALQACILKRIEEEQKKNQEGERRRKELDGKLHTIALQELRRRNELQAIEPLYSLIEAAGSDSFEVTLPWADLDAEDIELAAGWTENCHPDLIEDIRHCDPDQLEYILTSKGLSKDFHLGRMLSARAAEKSLLAYFKKRTPNARDISKTQLKEPRGGEWQTHDLLIDGAMIDVKNARRAQNSPGSYVEHCVPRFKMGHILHKRVLVAGVMSSYLWPKDLLAANAYSPDKRPIFLGTTSIDIINSLKKHFDPLGILQIELGNLGDRELAEGISDNFTDSSYLLPPWVFNYPDDHYNHRTSSQKKFGDLQLPFREVYDRILNGPQQILIKSFLPLMILGSIDPEEYADLVFRSEWERLFIKEIQLWRKEYGLSLPFLFLSILSFTLRMAYRNDDIASKFHPKKISDLIFPHSLTGAITERPLFIYDPLKTVSSLINNLSILWDKNLPRLKSYRWFKLGGLNILRGYNAEEKREETLIAYCGGRLPDYSKCGNSPLVIDYEGAELCPHCFHLICPKCHYCSSACSVSDESGLEMEFQ